MSRSLFVIIFAAASLYAASSSAVEPNAQLIALEEGAARGDLELVTELGGKYENAEGVPKDLEKARVLYCKAAKQGYAAAEFRLGWIYANGRGVPRDDAVAAELFTRAAQHGYEYAAKLLPYMAKTTDPIMPECLAPDAPVVTASLSSDDDDNAPAGDRSEIEQLVRQLAPQYAVDYRLALAVISTESGFNPTAVSPKKAQGLMQLIPETAERFGVTKVFSPIQNIKGGLAYLRWLLAFFKGDVPLVLAAYNAGERAVEKYHGIPPYPETRDYVKRITSIYRKTHHPYQADIVEPSPIMARINGD